MITIIFVDINMQLKFQFNLSVKLGLFVKGLSIITYLSNLNLLKNNQFLFKLFPV